MLNSRKSRWVIVALVALLTATAGLVVGKLKEKDYVKDFYQRQDFTLMDAQGGFFQLSKFPSDRLLLLIFTPDGIHPSFTKPFALFSKRVKELEALGIEVKMITRMNREIVRNFKEAARFPGQLLIDASGTVGRHLGIWPDVNPVNSWGYALIDNRLSVFWATTDSRPKSFDDLMKDLKKVSAQAVGKEP